MFTIQQIREAHAKVKSGADFPKYIRDIKTIGVVSYEHFLSDGHVVYSGLHDFTISGDSKWPSGEIAAGSNTEGLKSALRVHQAGQTDYLTFCREAAEAGVEKWVVDISAMTCTYFDLSGNEMLVETIPEI